MFGNKSFISLFHLLVVLSYVSSVEIDSGSSYVSFPANENGTCYKRVPYDDVWAKKISDGLVKTMPGFQPPSDSVKTDAYGAAVRVTIIDCCDGFARNNESNKCEAHCENGCFGGTCTGPNICTCELNGWLAEAGVCKPVCGKPCPENGYCFDADVCSCMFGYEEAVDVGAAVGGIVCRPVCLDGCPNGECVAPRDCRCKPGYRLDESRCVESEQSTPSRGNESAPIPFPRGHYPRIADTEEPARGVGPFRTIEPLGNTPRDSTRPVEASRSNSSPTSADPSQWQGLPRLQGPLLNPARNPHWPATADTHATTPYLQNPSPSPIAGGTEVGRRGQQQPANPWPHVIPPDDGQRFLIELQPPGFSEFSGWQLPSCDFPCYNGDCVARNVCACKHGYSLDPRYANVCSPVCADGCENGVCTAPNRCLCSLGFVKERPLTSNSRRCVPVRQYTHT